ncbi:MAG: 3'-5' exonuclease [Nitrosomonadaceae bacterium]
MKKQITYIILDFEATCCDDDSFPKSEREIIEFGVVAVDGSSLIALAEFEAFVKPIRRHVLTKFCTELTTITQEDVSGAKGFVAVLKEFAQWLAQFENPLFCSWGLYDKIQLMLDCVYHGVDYPFDEQHVNLKNEFSAVNGIRKNLGMKKALARANVTLEGTHHRGIDDARNMVKLLPYIFGNKRVAVQHHRQGKKR